MAFAQGVIALAVGTTFVSTTFRPKAVLLFGTSLTAAGTGTSISAFLGCATNFGSQYAHSFSDEDAQASSDNEGGASDEHCIYVRDFGNTTAVAFFELPGTNDPDQGFYLRITTASSARRVIWLAIGGDGVQCDVLPIPGATSTGDVDITGATDETGASFTPTGAIFMMSKNDNAVPDVYSSPSLCLGASDGTTQGVRAIGATDNQGAADTNHMASASYVIAVVGSAAAVTRRASWVQWLSTGVRINWDDIDAEADHQGCALVFRGISFKVIEFTEPAATGDQTVSGLGITPEGCLLIGQNDASNSLGEAGISLSIGGGAVSSEASVWYGSTDAADPTVADQALSETKGFIAYDATPTLIADMDISSFGSGQAVFNWTTVSGTQGTILGLFFASSSDTVYPISTPDSGSSAVASWPVAARVVDSNVATGSIARATQRCQVIRDGGGVYLFAPFDSSGMEYIKSPDRGVNFDATVDVSTASLNYQWGDVFRNRWITPTAATDVAYFAHHADSGTRGIYVGRIDLLTDTVTQSVLARAMSASPSARSLFGMCRDGTLWVSGSSSLGGNVAGLSTDAGDTWTTVGAVACMDEETADFGSAWPDYSNSNLNALSVIYWDNSAKLLQNHQIDLTAGTHTVTNICGLNAAGPNSVCVTMDPNSGTLYIVALDSKTTNNYDLHMFRVFGTEVTQLYDVWNNKDFAGPVACCYGPDAFYIIYGWDPDEVSATSKAIYYRRVSSPGNFFTPEAQYVSTEADIDQLFVDPIPLGNFLLPGWYEDTGNDYEIGDFGEPHGGGPPGHGGPPPDHGPPHPPPGQNRPERRSRDTGIGWDWFRRIWEPFNRLPAHDVKVPAPDVAEWPGWKFIGKRREKREYGDESARNQMPVVNPPFPPFLLPNPGFTNWDITTELPRYEVNAPLATYDAVTPLPTYEDTIPWLR